MVTGQGRKFLAEQRGDHGAEYDPNGAGWQPAQKDAGPPDLPRTAEFHLHILAPSGVQCPDTLVASHLLDESERVPLFR